MTPVEEFAAVATGHSNATMESTVVRGFVRDDADWRPAIETALRTIYANPDDLAVHARAIDDAMMRGAHAAARSGAIVALGVQLQDSKNPLRRLLWRVHGQRRARRRADVLNQQTAALEAAEEV